MNWSDDGETANMPLLPARGPHRQEIHPTVSDASVAEFTAAERETLLRLARATLARVAARKAGPQTQTGSFTGRLAEKRGCFVTLTKDGQLRGCIGQLTTEHPLYEGVAESTAGAALRDFRFESVQPDEVSEIRIEISVLTEPMPLVHTSPEDLLAQLQPFRDGVVLRIGARLSTFLPKVWEHIPEKIEFMDRLAQKAGCSASAWREPEARVSIYHTETFEEPLTAQQYA